MLRPEAADIAEGQFRSLAVARQHMLSAALELDKLFYGDEEGETIKAA